VLYTDVDSSPSRSYAVSSSMIKKSFDHRCPPSCPSRRPPSRRYTSATEISLSRCFLSYQALHTLHLLTNTRSLSLKDVLIMDRKHHRFYWWAKVCVHLGNAWRKLINLDVVECGYTEPIAEGRVKWQPRTDTETEEYRQRIREDELELAKLKEQVNARRRLVDGRD
jgi:hypothetical protein